MKTLNSIQALRGLAALMVVAYHAAQWIRLPVSIGAAGVDIFFVISGFIMWTTAWVQPVGPLTFLWRRVRRVIPLYWLATLTLAAAAALMPGVFPHVIPRAGHIVLSLLLIPHKDPEGWYFPLLSPGWTLSYEALFYIVFAGALLLPKDRRMLALAAALGPIAVGGYFGGSWGAFIANPMLLQFLAGALIGRLWLMKALPGPTAGAVLIAVAALLFLAAEALHTVPESLLRPFAWGVPAAVLVIGALACDSSRTFAHPVVRRLGDASYSIYLVHHPLMALINMVTGPINPVAFFALAVALPVAAGLLCHRFIERPLLNALRGPAHAQGEAVSST